MLWLFWNFQSVAARQYTARKSCHLDFLGDVHNLSLDACLEVLNIFLGYF